MKKLIVGAVVALAVAAFLPRAASAGIWENGIWENGIWENGIWSNGIWDNGVRSNGLNPNDMSLQALKVPGLRIDATLVQGHERPAGPLCTERGVDLSAVPVVKVTVRLPQPMS